MKIMGSCCFCNGNYTNGLFPYTKFLFSPLLWNQTNYMATVLITGGTGLIGGVLTKELINKGYAVIILTRNKRKYKDTEKIRYAEWDVKKQTIEKEAIAKAD